jgi:hypothetical protein
MRHRLAVLGWVAIGVVATIGVMAAQQSGQTAPPGAAQGPMFQMIHAGCAAGQADGAQAQTSHVPKHLATVLELSEAQIADMDAIAAEACAAMEQFHGRMRNVLTPAQLEKAKAIHGSGHGHGGVGGWFKKLHGGD